MALKQSFKVRDFRDKGFFMIDDAYLNGYAKILGLSTSMIYFALCRSVDKYQIAFPSQDYLAEKIGIHPRTVRRHIKKLLEWNIIRVEKIRNHKGRFLHNTYYLLDKSEWKQVSRGHQSPVDVQRTPVSTSRGHQRPHKDTHNKETHISLYSKPENLTDKDFQEIADKYQVPLAFVRSKYDDMVLWAGERPNNPKVKGRNWRLTLMKWVKSDAIKIKERGNPYVRPAIDARQIT